MSSSENGSIPHAGTGSRIVPGPPSQEELLQNHEEVSSNALAPGEEPAPGLEEECNLRVSKRSIKRPKTLAELLEEKEKLSGVAGERAAKDRANVNEKIKRLVDPAFKKRRNGQNAACQRRRRKALKDSRAAASASTAGSNVAGAAGSSNAASAAMAAGFPHCYVPLGALVCPAYPPGAIGRPADGAGMGPPMVPVILCPSHSDYPGAHPGAPPAVAQRMLSVLGHAQKESEIRNTFQYLLRICTDPKDVVCTDPKDVEAALTLKLDYFKYALENAGVGNNVLDLIKQVQPKYSPENLRSENETLLISFILDALPLVSTNKFLLRLLVNYTLSVAYGKTSRNGITMTRYDKIVIFQEKMRTTLGDAVSAFMISHRKLMLERAASIPFDVMHEIAHFLYYDDRTASVYRERSPSRHESLDHWATFSECKVEAGKEDALVHHARVLVQIPSIQHCVKNNCDAGARQIMKALKKGLSGLSEGSSKSSELWKSAHQDLQLEEVLGRGSFGTVVSVSSKAKPRFRAAIKLESHADARAMMTSFVQPYLFAMMVDSPYVVKLYGFFEVPVFHKENVFATTALFMELCGDSLGSEMARVRETPGNDHVRFSLKRTRDMLHAIVAIQKERIVHRDVKPDNYVLGLDHHSTLKLTDFGVAVYIPEGKATIELGEVAGEEPYISDDAFEGIYDLSTDVYSVGVILTQLLKKGEGTWHPCVAMLLDGENDPIETDLKVFLDRMLDRNDSGEAPVAFSNAKEALVGLEELLEKWKTYMSVA